MPAAIRTKKPKRVRRDGSMCEACGRPNRLPDIGIVRKFGRWVCLLCDQTPEVIEPLMNETDKHGKRPALEFLHEMISDEDELSWHLCSGCGYLMCCDSTHCRNCKAARE